MILSANQPYFLPYLPYWQLIHASDLFLLGDDYNYIKGGWVKRNRLLLNGEPKYFGVSVRESSFQMISQLSVQNADWSRLLNQIYEAYHKAPHYAAGLALMEEILACEDRTLSEFLFHSIRVVAAYLGITTPIGRTSEFEGNRLYRREERIYDLCRRVHADVYANAPGGRALYAFKDFRERGIQLQFIQPEPIVYRQFREPFVPNLSILDVIMFNSREEVQAMLNRFTWARETHVNDRRNQGLA